MTSQNIQILAYLQKGNSITALGALRRFGCLRLAARIYDIKQMGYKISKKNRIRNKKTYISYTLG